MNLIFDLDGTLVDSSPGILASLSVAFSASKLEPVEPLNNRLIGPPLREVLHSLCADPEPAVLDNLINQFKAHYDTAGFKQTNPFPKVEEMIRTLSRAKIPMHIATNKRAHPTKQILDAMGWSRMFDKILSPDSFNPALPRKSAILIRLLAEANLASQDCLYIGDRYDDYKAAKEAGIQFALAEWGFEGDSSTFNEDTVILKTPSAEYLMKYLTDKVARWS